MDKFWDGLKHSSAFSFYFDEEGKIIPTEETAYMLYEADVFPFTVFAKELQSLNDYCFMLIGQVEQETQERDMEQKEMENRVKMGAAEYEWMISAELETGKWKWLSDITIPYAVILLYAFLEKTMKYVFHIFEEENRFSERPRIKRPYLYSWIGGILGMSPEEVQEKYPKAFAILDECRRLRNNFAHECLEGVKLSGDYVSQERTLSPSFRLIDFINVITFLLNKTEEKYL